MLKSDQAAANEAEPEDKVEDEELSLDFFLEPEPTENLQTEIDADTEISSQTTNADSTDNSITKPASVIDTSNIISTPTEQIQTLPDGTQYQIDNPQFMALPASHYVLQLTAVSSQAVLAEYLASAPVETSQLRIYQIRRNDTDWIVVTYGLFDSIDKARAEAQKVAPNAWAKSVSVIQQQINAYHNSIENP